MTGVAGDLPAGEIDRLQPGLDLLQRLIAGQGAERVDEGLGVDQIPELLRAAAGQRVLDAKRAGEADHVAGRVRAAHSFPAWVLGPVLLESADLFFPGRCMHSSSPES